MSVKTFLKLFIPPIFIKIVTKSINFFLSFKITINSKSNINSVIKNNNNLIVIGNGPSLNESMKKYEKCFSKYDCIAVNHFCETEYYQIIKPKYYLIADPAFYGNIDTYAEWLKEKINNFISEFINNTKWDINIILPTSAIDSQFIQKLKHNKFIHPYYYNYKDLIKYKDDKKFYFWDKNLISVPAQTCLNTCIWLGIFLRYDNIYLIGADTSWIELLHVDQKNNTVYTIDSHFYGKKRRQLFKDKEGKNPVKLHEELYSILKAFEYYWELKNYADYAGVNIYNASEYSLIDAYERKEIE